MARLVVTSGLLKGREFHLGDSQTIGRLASNEIPISDSRMSRANTRIYCEDDHWRIEDLDSKNGTFVNGETVRSAALQDSDEVRVGETEFGFVLDPGDAEKLVASRPRPVAAPAAPEIKLDDVGSSKVRRVGDQPLSFSPHADQQTVTSFHWLRQDLAQRDGFFRLFVFVGVVLIALGLFWLVQLMVAGD